MPSIRTDIKTGAHVCGRTLADLCRETKIPYQRLSGAVNGYFDLSPVDEELIRQAFARWKTSQVVSKNV